MTNTPSGPIKNLDQLKQYLQVALQLEHATIPPYLTGAYTAKIEANKSSGDIIRAVAKEEMLHLTLAANLLNAVGGSPDLVRPDFVPRYPTPLPSGETDFLVSIQRFSAEAIETFLKIERPSQPEASHEPIVKHLSSTVRIDGEHLDEETRGTVRGFVRSSAAEGGDFNIHYDIALIPHHCLSPESRASRRASIIPACGATGAPGDADGLHFWSIGDFYKAIHLGFAELARGMGEGRLFTGDPGRQIAPEHYYSAGGELTRITSLKTALAAVDLIAGQGEGGHDRIYDDEGELSHFFRFDQIKQGRYYRDPNEEGGDEPFKPRGRPFPVDMGAVYPIKTDAKIADYGAFPELKSHALAFNAQYKEFLGKLHRALNGEPELLKSTFASEMFRIKAAMETLIRNPIPGTEENAAPTFE